ncbi:MAG: amidohydrolase family protein [Pseudomonadota bacterium]|nr:amidohydrolase family protein [Pseudomonadota bacterium]
MFSDVRIFDGTSDALSPPSHVLVRGATIAEISQAPIAAPAGAQVIDGQGGTLMPGLIDAHAHLIMGAIPMGVLMTGSQNYIQMRAARAAEEFLMRGFTTARDLAGPTFGLKQAIDEGYAVGPRIYPSGAMISQTSGHGDFRMISELPREGGDLHYTERFGFSALADGEAEVLRRAREQLMQGASQIKLAAGGGVSSNYDPLDVTQFTEAEMRAAVEAAAAWNTYVTVHAYTPAAIRQAIRAGVQCIDHGQLADEETVKMMAEAGVWWSMQPFLDDAHAIPFPEGTPNRAKQIEMSNGTDTAYALAKKYGVKLAWGTDTLFDPELAKKQGEQLTKMVRWFTPAEVLKIATHDNARLLALSGPRNPYPGELGVVKEGALADLLLVRGDVLADIRLLEDPQANLAVIMKNGRIHKGPGVR